MSDTSEPREYRLKRLHMRSWRRGMKEMDLILGHFADDGLGRLTDEQLDLYERMLGENDQDLYLWVTARIKTESPVDRGAPDFLAPMLEMIADHAAARFAAGK
ncbi:succinate dehydrogenase assembly factor 2 [Paracoccus zeaxanthinifaciens]|uniref:FAD assembly factor SdhE n=1 Tax=Paracoccus zeaxanthinifaciens TaxID=187400 RepID=UPI0003B5307C|nr:succinate dehydrogenase assembly factor 2 [Paracoccus zeaxanthinifaciens]